ncbi:hypothetical protein GRI89_08740 [Altererythrobacter salegens]|uniref:Type IV pilus biogenesis protein PilP n=1 Tax=Croceibacterium salegens TaxID=1737568 RepID=A0A6I4SXP5_9SPHN|nr:hypothetical protein [Croceibacterium salegens]MXO59626.1 hypothetical protein [Croceibacterium salegens]
MTLALRATLLLAGSAMAVAATPVTAQVSNDIVLNIMRECAKIDDPTARLACYDNNIRAAGGNPSSVPGQMPSPSGGGAVLQPQATAGGFGSDDLRARSDVRFDPNRYGARQITPTVSGVRERQPHTYLVELNDGAQWLMTESGGTSFRPPRKGDSIEIQRGALGGYLMVVGSQQAVRVERVK